MTDSFAPPVPAASSASRLLRTRVRRKSLTHDLGYWLVVAGVMANCFANHWGDLGLPGPIDRVLLATGFTIEFIRAQRSGTLPRLNTSAAVLVAASTWAALSFIAAPIHSQPGFFLLVDLYVIPAVLFIGAPILFGTRHRRFAFAASFAVFGIYLGTNAIAQTLHVSALVFPSYVLDPSVGIHAERARGPYAESVGMGLMLIYSGVLGGYVARTAKLLPWRLIGAFSVALCIIGAALTLTRAIWLAAIAVVIIAVLLLPELRRRTPLIICGAALGAAAFLTLFPDFLASATDRGEALTPIYDRLNVNQAAVSMTIDHPLFGVGWNQAGYVMPEYIRLGKDYPVTAAAAGLIPHNVFLAHFAELGILGASVWLASVVAAVAVPIAQRHRPGFGAWRLILLCFATCWAIVANFGPVNYSQPQYMLFLVGGITAMGRAVAPSPWDWRPRNRRRSPATASSASGDSTPLTLH